MKLLWFTSQPMPPLERHLGRPTGVLAGWLWSLASQIATQVDVQLAIATSVPGAVPAEVRLDGVRYYVLSRPRSQSYLVHTANDLEQAFKVVADFNPDLIHVHGTEGFYGLIGTSQRVRVPIVISMQGLLTRVGRYLFADLSLADRVHVVRIRDIARRVGPLFEALQMWRAGERELEIIRKNQYFIGRSEWDCAWLRAINPSATYHFCNETLRRPFFERTWSADKVTRHSLLFTNAMSPNKGIHTLLEAVGLLQQAYPGVHLTLAGNWFPGSGLGRAVVRKVAALDIEPYVTFAGNLTAIELSLRLETTHVFVSPSFVENSPNSIAEAMAVGTPCVAAFVGGVTTMLSHGVTGLMVPAGDPAMLASAIRRLFESDELACKLSEHARIVARERHDAEAIVSRQLEIYSEVLRAAHGKAP